LFLSRREILSLINRKRLQFDPPVTNDRIEQVSVDLLLGREFAAFKEVPHVASVCLEPSIWDSLDLWEKSSGDVYELKPKSFVLAQTLERVSIPNDVVGLVEGRSRYARLGLTTHLTAPKIDPGFTGRITLEIANLGSLTIKLRAGIDSIAQLMFIKTRPLRKKELYGAAPGDLFQNQTGPVPKVGKKKN
jgi:dCTP deaminase